MITRSPYAKLSHISPTNCDTANAQVGLYEPCRIQYKNYYWLGIQFRYHINIPIKQLRKTGTFLNLRVGSNRNSNQITNLKHSVMVSTPPRRYVWKYRTAAYRCRLLITPRTFATLLGPYKDVDIKRTSCRLGQRAAKCSKEVHITEAEKGTETMELRYARRRLSLIILKYQRICRHLNPPRTNSQKILLNH
jgi:hypothetical protein